MGGGPAGALAARGLALRGQRVALIEARSQAHDKVCGACLHPEAVRELDRAGLGQLLEHAQELSSLELFRNARRVRLQVALGRVLSRRALDEALLLAAVHAGVELRRGHSAVSLTTRHDGVELDVRAPTGEVAREHASVVLLANGLGNLRVSSSAGPSASRAAAGSAPTSRATTASRASAGARARRPARARRLGAGAILPASAPGPERGLLQMFVAPEGYMGVVRLEDDRLDLAAAFDAEALRNAGGAADLAARLFARADHALHEFAGRARWRGTPALARPEAPTLQHVLPLGDAAGSVEPFTGEGLRRAFVQANAVVEHTLDAVAGNGQAAARWARTRRELLRANTARVNRLAGALRHPRVVALGVGLASLWPAAAERVAGSLHGRTVLR
ncbi:MAG: hypothetical protein DHS20C15_32850 [Planctomycetota bacterium]|nr:MAG: hypothetical protein DHS20C15_32850 [Planctomycetota bacterium]